MLKTLHSTRKISQKTKFLTGFYEFFAGLYEATSPMPTQCGPPLLKHKGLIVRQMSQERPPQQPVSCLLRQLSSSDPSIPTSLRPGNDSWTITSAYDPFSSHPYAPNGFQGHHSGDIVADQQCCPPYFQSTGTYLSPTCNNGFVPAVCAQTDAKVKSATNLMQVKFHFTFLFSGIYHFPLTYLITFRLMQTRKKIIISWLLFATFQGGWSVHTRSTYELQSFERCVFLRVRYQLLPET